MKRKTNQPTKQRPTRLYHNFRLTMLLILVPLTIGIAAIYYALSGPLSAQLSTFGSKRLITDNWQIAYTQLANAQPEYGQKVAYYRMELGQDINWVAQHFSVDPIKLKQLNTGQVVYGTTIAIPPVEGSLQPFNATSGNFTTIVLQEIEGVWHLSNDFRNPIIQTTIPQLADLLAPQGVITKITDKHYRLNKPISIEGNIRLDITSETVSKLELASSQNFGITCLCFENAEVLIKGTTITSVDPATGGPDLNQADGRSFIRARKNTRMDIINSDISYLGNDLLEGRLQNPVLRSGATYGVSWKVSDDTLGQDIVTGWVEDSTFRNNRFGAYTFGASGMVWRNNLFTKNEVYGLDPHDDSNNATIENNRFIANGRHGFIVSKRCNFNTIRNNISVNNGGHGYMLHEDSNYNLLAGNIAIANTDNFVIYDSDLNTIRFNKSYNPSTSHVRINAASKQNFIQDNLFYGGKRGIYLHDRTDSVLVERNIFNKLDDEILTTKGAMRVLWVDNQVDGLRYKIEDGDRVVFGPNQIDTKPAIDLTPLNQRY